MGLLDIFRKKEENITDLKGDLSKLINKGILFEDSDLFLKWNIPIGEIKKQVVVQEKLFADRAAYNWGEQSILNGLRLSLSTTFWYHKEESADKKLKTISFHTEGNEIADDSFKLIIAHLEKEFKPATAKEITETSTYLEWVIGDVKMSLYLFEKYSVNRLQFEICKL